MKTFAEFMLECSQLDEGGLARAISKSTTHDSGHISADRGSDESANREKRKKLEGKLKKKGIGFKKSTGSCSLGVIAKLINSSISLSSVILYFD